MLSSYPTQINGETIPFPDTWSENPQKIVNQFETEAGGLKHIVIRSSRLSADASFTVTSRWLKKFLQFRNLDQLTVTIYNAVSDSRTSHTMFIDPESFSYELVHESRYAQNTNGIYKLSFSIEEF
jgi:hypothetical protein